MKLFLFKSVAALLTSARPSAAEEMAGRAKRRHLREAGVDPTLSKFDVDGKKLFDDVNPNLRERSLIVNGQDVNPPRKYPFFVSIRGGVCGASLVAPNVILTAASCVVASADPMSAGPAFLGLHNRTVDNAEEFQHVEIIDFADMVIHPNFTTSFSYNYFDNDTAVIQLAHDSQLYQDKVVELDSPYDDFELAAGEEDTEQDLTVIGMGTTSYGMGPHANYLPNTLQEVTVDYITNEACCTDDYHYFCKGITENMMCAARPEKGWCGGDRGGPIFDTATQKQVGIASWGIDCANPHYPGVYSRISAQYDWIKEQIDIYSSNGTNPPAPKVPDVCYDAPENWYWSDPQDPQGFMYNCDSDSVDCSDDYVNGGITSNMACCKCEGGGEIYTGEEA